MPKKQWYLLALLSLCFLASAYAIHLYIQRTPDASPLSWAMMSPQEHAKMRPWTHIVIHHSAADAGSTQGIDRHHREVNHWDGIGYHFVIGNGHGMRLGRIEYTFRWDQQREGAHAGGSDRSYNQQGIGICIIGDFHSPRPADAPALDTEPAFQTQSQRCALLCALLIENLPTLSVASIIGHRDVPGKSTHCPGQHVNLRHFRATVRTLLAQRKAQREAQQETQKHTQAKAQKANAP